MQQRRLRLGDILDDYCPRERRVTNHAVVAMVEQDVKQTRCTTCDAEHEYKEARTPVLRRRKDSGVLSGGVSADALRARRATAPPDDALEDETLATDDLPADLLADDAFPPEPILDTDDRTEDAALVAAALEALQQLDEDADGNVEPAHAAGDDDGPVHRRLIRATLPRVEGQTIERKEVDFTVRQPGGRGRETDGNRPGNRPGGAGAAGGRGRRPQQQRWQGSGQPSAGGSQAHRGPGGTQGTRGRGGPSHGQPQGQPGHRQAGPGQRPAGPNQPHGRKRGR